MTKREKIIVGVMLGAVILATGDWALRSLGPGAAARSSGDGVATDVIAAQVGAHLAALRLDPHQRRIRELAGLPWQADMFQATTADRPTGAAVVEISTSQHLPAYTGFLRIGSRSLGILNGLEYAEGDWSEDGSYQILRLSPDRAELLPRGQDVSVMVQMER